MRYPGQEASIKKYVDTLIDIRYGPLGAHAQNV